VDQDYQKTLYQWVEAMSATHNAINGIYRWFTITDILICFNGGSK
jgi:hypothetical protein